MADFYTIVTAIGKAKIANSTVLGTKVNFAKLKVGDGNGSYYEPTEDQTTLRHVVWEGNVNNIATGGEANPNWIVVQTVIPPSTGGFTIREAGIFDEADNLLAISKYPESYKPKMEDGSTSDLTIELIFEVSNASSVTLKVDPLVITASKKDIQDLDAKIQLQIEATNTQLSDMDNKISPVKITSSLPMVSFVDDDTPDTVFTKLKPLFDSKGIKGTLACVTGKLDTVNNLTTAQLIQLYNESWEIAGHSVNHKAKLTDMSLTDAEGEIKGCLERLTALGIKADHFVYPWNTSNYDVQKLVRQYFKLGVGEIDDYPTNGIPLFSGELTRRNLGADFNAGTDTALGATDGDVANTLNYYKWLVDYAVSTKTWLIFVTHSSAMSGNQYTYLSQTIDYIKSLNLPIVTLSEGYKTWANRYEDGVFGWVTNDPNGTSDFNVTDRNGYRYSGRELVNYKGDNTVLTINSLLSAYKIGITWTTYGGASVFPEGAGGILKTVRTNTDSQSYQMWIPVGSTNMYIRHWNQTTGSWGTFIGQYNSYNTTYNSQADIPAKTIFYGSISNAIASANNYPEGKGGLLTTYNLNTDVDKSFCRQEYFVISSRNKYTRYCDSTGTFGAWYLMNPTTTTLTIDGGTIPANSFGYVSVAISNLRTNCRITASPFAGVVDGILWNAECVYDGQLRMRFFNPTANPITIGSRTWNISFIN